MTDYAISFVQLPSCEGPFSKQTSGSIPQTSEFLYDENPGSTSEENGFGLRLKVGGRARFCFGNIMSSLGFVAAKPHHTAKTSFPEIQTHPRSAVATRTIETLD